jgi:release factor glutamine methyltransferase
VRTTVFGGLRIDHDESMLPPRDWTLSQSQWAAELLADAPDGPVLELCAGAGHIGLAAIHDVRRPLVAVELNPRACRLLRVNADRAGLGALVDVREGRVDEALGPDERFALVIADPPWVRTAEVSDFPDDPVGTIDGGADGLDIARQCVAVIAGHLRLGGSAIVQVGLPDQAEAVCADLPAHLEVVEVRQAVRGVLVRLDAV